MDVRVDMDDVMTNNFEIFVQGKDQTYLVHSRMKKNHKLFVDEDSAHMNMVKQSIKDIIGGKEPKLAESRKKQEKATKRSMEEIAAEAAEKEEEKAKKKEEAEKRKAEMAKAREEEEEAKKKSEEEEKEKKKKAEEAKKKAEAAKKKKKAAEAKAKAKAKEEKASPETTESTTASLQSAEGSENSGENGESKNALPRVDEAAEEVQKAEEKMDPPPEQAAPEADASLVNQAVEAKMKAYIPIEQDESSQATKIEKSAECSVERDDQKADQKVEALPVQELKVASDAGGDGTSDRRSAPDALLEVEEREAAREASRAKADGQTLASLFGFTCCRSSKLEDSSGEVATIKPVDDDLLNLGGR